VLRERRDLEPGSWRFPVSLRLALCACALAVGTGLRAGAAELSSASFLHRAGHTAAAGTGALANAAPAPRHSGGGASVGQAEAIGLSGLASDLRSSAPGFWPIAVGGLPAIDLDGDGLRNSVDDDDDGDGLADGAETDTGVFVSAADTGSDALIADSDGDGFGDGFEVEHGSDPNDPLSLPNVAVPALPALWRALIGLALPLAALALALARRTRRGAG